MRSPAEFIFSLLVMALFPALFEETLFRGGLQQILVAWFKKPLLAITITSIIFSAVHFSYYGFFFVLVNCITHFNISSITVVLRE